MKHLKPWTERQTLLQLRQIPRRDWHDGGVDGGGRGTLVLPGLGIHFMTERDIGHDLPKALSNQTLVDRIGVGV
jgi:hypothetical protein